VTAALLRNRTGTQAPPPGSPDQAPPADPGMSPLTVPEVKRILAALTARPLPPRTSSTGTPRPAATRHAHAGNTTAHACNGTTPWSASQVRLPYSDAGSLPLMRDWTASRWR
jgi:hypothetical protein